MSGWPSGTPLTLPPFFFFLGAPASTLRSAATPVLRSSSATEDGEDGSRRQTNISPNSEVGEHARLGRDGTRLASRASHDVIQPASLELFRTTHDFPRGAENSARGGRVPFSISEFGISRRHATSRRDAGAPRTRSHSVWALTESCRPNMLLLLCCTVNWFPPPKRIRGD